MCDQRYFLLMFYQLFHHLKHIFHRFIMKISILRDVGVVSLINYKKNKQFEIMIISMDRGTIKNYSHSIFIYDGFDQNFGPLSSIIIVYHTGVCCL